MSLLLLSMDRKVMGSRRRWCDENVETNDHLHPFFLFFKLASESPFAFQKKNQHESTIVLLIIFVEHELLQYGPTKYSLIEDYY